MAHRGSTREVLVAAVETLIDDLTILYQAHLSEYTQSQENVYTLFDLSHFCFPSVGCSRAFTNKLFICFFLWDGEVKGLWWQPSWSLIHGKPFTALEGVLLSDVF